MSSFSSSTNLDDLLKQNFNSIKAFVEKNKIETARTKYELAVNIKKWLDTSPENSELKNDAEQEPELYTDIKSTMRKLQSEAIQSAKSKVSKHIKQAVLETQLNRYLHELLKQYGQRRDVLSESLLHHQ